MRPEGVYPFTKRVNDPTKEYVAVRGYTEKQATALASTIDDAEIEIDSEFYARMSNDSAITKCRRIIITSALTDNIEMTPDATEDNVSEEEYKIHKYVTQFCERVVKGLKVPLRTTLEQQLDNAFNFGHGIGEVVWEYRLDGFPQEKKEEKTPSPKKQSFLARIGLATEPQEDTKDSFIKRPALEGEKLRLMPSTIKIKPRGTLRFVVDNYMNELGMTTAVRTSQVKFNEIIARDKFTVLTLNKQNEDPRGRSMNRPAVNWYNIKSQFPAEILRFILEESVPKAVATLGPNASPFEYERDPETGAIIKDENGQPKMLTAVESMAKLLEGFRGGSGAVIPNGATLEPFKKGINTDANLFPIMMKLINDEIENCILLQTLAQSEGDHQARSASQQVAEILYNLMFWIKYSLAQCVINDLLVPAVRYNIGEWALKYLPQVSFGDFIRRDWVSELTAISDSYFKGFIDDTQRAELSSWMGLPKPGLSRQQLANELAQPDVNGDVQPPPNKRPDKQAGDRNKNNGTEKNNVITRSGPTNPLGNHSRWFRRS